MNTYTFVGADNIHIGDVVRVSNFDHLFVSVIAEDKLLMSHEQVA